MFLILFPIWIIIRCGICRTETQSAHFAKKVITQGEFEMKQLAFNLRSFLGDSKFFHIFLECLSHRVLSMIIYIYIYIYICTVYMHRCVSWWSSYYDGPVRGTNMDWTPPCKNQVFVLLGIEHCDLYPLLSPSTFKDIHQTCPIISISTCKWLAGWWFGTWLLFSHILGLIIPINFHIFQRGRYTTNQSVYVGSWWFTLV